MGVISGMSGHIATGAGAIAGTSKWSVEHTGELAKSVSSASAGATTRSVGTKDFTGSFTTYGIVPAVMPGDSFTFYGAITGYGPTAQGCSGACIVDSVTIHWDIEGAKPITHEVKFSSNGALTLGTITVPADVTLHTPITSIGCDLLLGTMAGSPVWTSVGQVRTMSMTISRSNAKGYISSGLGWPSRAKGNLDVEIEATLYADPVTGVSSFPKTNDVTAAKLMVNGTQFWHVNWIRWETLGNIDVDIEGATLVGASVKGGLSAYEAISGVQTQGVLVPPSGPNWWP